MAGVSSAALERIGGESALEMWRYFSTKFSTNHGDSFPLQSQLKYLYTGTTI
jgi:hypothetical protein